MFHDTCRVSVDRLHIEECRKFLCCGFHSAASADDITSLHVEAADLGWSYIDVVVTREEVLATDKAKAVRHDFQDSVCLNAAVKILKVDLRICGVALGTLVSRLVTSLIGSCALLDALGVQGTVLALTFLIGSTLCLCILACGLAVLSVLITATLAILVTVLTVLIAALTILVIILAVSVVILTTLVSALAVISHLALAAVLTIRSLIAFGSLLTSCMFLTVCTL